MKPRMTLLGAICLLCCACGIRPVCGETPSCGIGAAQDYQQAGHDLLSWWDNPTVGWTITCKFWAPNATPTDDNTTAGDPAEVTVSTGTAAIDIDTPHTQDYDALGWIQAHLSQIGADDAYMYRNRNVKTGTVVRYAYSSMLYRCY